MAERGHVVIPRAPLIPKDDPTTLFTGSGMQPLLPYLLGADHPVRLAARRQPDVPPGAGRRRGGRQPPHDLLRDARQLEPRRLLQAGADPAGVDLPDREGRSGPRSHLRLVLQRRSGPRHPEGRGGRRRLDAAVRGSGNLVRSGRRRHRGARRERRHRRRADRLLRQEELVVPGRQGRGHARRRAGRARHRDLLPVPERRPTTRPTGCTAIRTATAGGSSSSAIRSSWSTGAPSRGSSRCRGATSTTAAGSPGSRPRRWTARTSSGSGCSGRSSSGSRSCRAGRTKTRRARCG